VRTSADSQNNLQFWVRLYTRFGYIIENYCKQVGINTSSICLLFDGNRINPDDTPQSLQIDSNDT